MHNSCSDAKQARWMARGQLPQLAACETAGEADFFPNLKPLNLLSTSFCLKEDDERGGPSGGGGGG
eukprot:CAMPEP_0182805868 /NCGR_PEP_ID=MMETSP0006_2-20121128/5295_1 /TAXON_ID=97485 /ORGANISM="Prymnesium parvum, Strain Texoma1" /LENGTH=65 /DNA_ID=CAMNT_0024931445 /DNA_START=289 /DNA_END=482 /DNA_ORIENTATION=+